MKYCQACIFADYFEMLEILKCDGKPAQMDIGNGDEDYDDDDDDDDDDSDGNKNIETKGKNE